MPGFHLHFLLAARTAGGDRSADAAYFAGALAPDMGYIPGGVKFVSDLAHFVKTGQLCRALAELAESAEEQAFARGWATHVLADVAIHPLINRAAAELVPEANAASLTHHDHPVAHIRVEQGLDAVLAARSPLGFAVRPRISIQCTSLLERAYRTIYGVDLGLELRRSCRVLNRSTPIFEAYGRVAGHSLGEAIYPAPHPLLPLGYSVLRAISALYSRSALFGLMRPAAPAPWLLAEVERVIASVSEPISTVIPDFNLDTGETGGHYPPAEVTLEALRQATRPG